MALVDRDDEHLKILAICYVAWAAWTSLTGLFALVFVAMGIFVTMIPLPNSTRNGQPPPDWFGWMFAGIGIVLLIFALGMAALSYFCGRFLRQRRHPVYCMIVACLNCLSMPFGTVLGVATIVVLQREEVRRLFEQRSAMPPPLTN